MQIKFRLYNKNNINYDYTRNNNDRWIRVG